jgi:putative endonuclease
MTLARSRLGRLGEDLACRELARRGYVILARRWRRRLGEIDIIARDGTTLVFVEVKARGGHAFGDAVEAVTWHKQRRLVRLAQQYLACARRLECACRFDVVSIHFDDATPVVTVFQHAFDATGVAR